MAARIHFDDPTLSRPTVRTATRAPRFAPIGSFRALIERWRQRRLLEQLDERMLRDIGISRSEALAEARKPWWQT